jgi:hypothetical protein
VEYEVTTSVSTELSTKRGCLERFSFEKVLSKIVLMLEVITS